MAKLLLSLLLLVGTYRSDDPKGIIKEKMDKQVECWNKGNLNCYMKAAYWQSDSLKFIGGSGITYGFERTLERYKVGYPTKEEMGTLSFTILSMEMIGEDVCFVVGQYHLERENEDTGYFSLLWRRIDDDWVIVADHSSN
ncbi:MAG: nuclear transport factor 2 family protein [Cyclobacteriaceae bacterium]|nr:nuclear transport factor 2 family protein [Cyclobacteriaceae bacterium]